jgi:hypothetical protein
LKNGALEDYLNLRRSKQENKKNGIMKVFVIFKQEITVVFEYDINKTYKNKYRHNFINNLSAATCFGFVSRLQAK